MTEKHFILATAGHVDHGKSSLVKALTGTDPDRLPEEKLRGITIDLGFAYLELPAPSTLKPELSTFSIGIIDVPGHEDFVRNMIAGVGSIDLALLSVAANEGWMPQTEEHFQILCYLGIKRLVVAVTKSDLAAPEKVASQVREQLRDTPVANAPIVSTSAASGSGLSDLKSALASEFASLPAARDIGKARLFVDRAFMLRGIGSIVTGTLIDGSLRTGDIVSVQPRTVSARIRSLQTHGRNVDVVRPGTRTAINLPDLELETQLTRGDVVTTHQFEPAVNLDVVLTRSPRSQRAVPIKSGRSAYVHHGTTRALSNIIIAGGRSLVAGGTAVAHLRFETPRLIFVGDRFIVRDASGQHTIAGGLVINIGNFRSDQERALVASRAVAPEDVALAVWTEIARGDILQPSQLLERSRFGSYEIANALKRLAEHGEIFLTENVAAKMVVWREVREQAAGLIDAAHKAHPERRGPELSELRAGLKSLPQPVFDALIVDLCRADFVRAGSSISRASHRANLPSELKISADKLRQALSAKPFDPPGRKELVKAQDEHQALKFLIEQGDIIHVSDEIVLLRGPFEQMQAIVSDFISANGLQ